MKSTELMIGDWVYSLIDRDGYVEKNPVRITGIRTDSDSPALLQTDESDVWYHIETYEPIPITVEILEKNFEKKTFYGIYDDFFDLDIREYSDGIYIVTYHSCEMSIPDQTVHVSWAHELQNFMNHCGIENDIEL